MARKTKTAPLPRAERRRAAREAARGVDLAVYSPFVPRERAYKKALTPDEIHARAVQRRDQARAVARALGDPLGRIELHRPPHHYRGTPARPHRNRQIIEKMRVNGYGAVSRLSMVL